MATITGRTSLDGVLALQQAGYCLRVSTSPGTDPEVTIEVDCDPCDVLDPIVCPRKGCLTITEEELHGHDDGTVVMTWWCPVCKAHVTQILPAHP